MLNEENWETIYKTKWEILEKMYIGNGWLVRNIKFADYDYTEDAYSDAIALTFVPDNKSFKDSLL